jgi:hypothetical protein
MEEVVGHATQQRRGDIYLVDHNFNVG